MPYSFTVILYCALFGYLANASTFYVSFSNGNDNNNGISPTAPWKTLQHALSTRLAPGDALLLRQGDTWALSQSLNVTNVRGTGVSPIVISYYADASSGDDRPIIARISGGDQTGMLLNFHNGCGLSLIGLELIGAEVGLGFTFDAQSAPPPAAGYTNYSVSDCVFRDQHGSVYNANTGSWWGSAIAFAREGGSAVTASSVLITHCLFTACDQAYTNNLPEPTFSPSFWTRAYIDGLQVST